MPIDFSSENTIENIKLLLNGMMYSELPPIINYEKIHDCIYDTFDILQSEKSKYYTYNDIERIQDFKGVPETPNRYKNGAEPIVFFDFKNNGAWREMQIPNIIYYLAFVYNTISVFDELFEPLYLSDEFKKYVCNSNSYLVFGDLFLLHDEYGNQDVDFKGQFTDRNTKKISSLFLEENKERYLREEDSYLYYLKLDIESFFPNLYTHFFHRMKNSPLYKGFDIDDYFRFLDHFNMRISNNQTKGIPAGVFSSHISSELLMLCIDDEIWKIIKDMNVGYVRYVDDMTFFSDEKDSLYEVKTICQQILNRYRLRINGNKTEIRLCTRKQNQTDISNIDMYFPYLNNQNTDKKEFYRSDLLKVKEYVRQCLEAEKIAQVKTLLTKITNKIQKDLIIFKNCEYDFFVYIWKLIGEDEKLSVHVYRLLDSFLEYSSFEDKEKCLHGLKAKNKYIDRSYNDSVLQIWHYYTLFKHCSEYKEEVITSITDINPSPIICSMLVKKGKEQNRKLFAYIREEYKRELGEKNSEWKDSIMLSKWWLPVLNIFMADEFNYDEWLHSEHFPDVLQPFSA